MERVNAITRRAPQELRAPEPDGRTLRGRDVLDVGFRRWKGILAVFLLVLAAAAAIALLRPPRYEARASILVRYGSEYVYRPEPGEQRLPIALTPEEILNSEAAILTSHDLLREVVEAIGPARLLPSAFGRAPTVEQAVDAFRRGLEVEGVRRSSVLAVAFRHPDPEVAAEALHVLVDRFEEKHVSVFSEATLAFLERQLGAYEAALREADGRLEAFRQEHGVFEYAEQMQLLLRRRAELEAVQREAGVEAAEAQSRLAALRGSLARPHPPEVMAAVQTDAIRLEGEARSLRARQAEAAQLLAALGEEIRVLDRTERQLAALRRDVEQAERNHETYRARVEEVRVAAALGAQNLSNISVIDPGTVPTRPVGFGRALALALAVVLAALSAAVYALLAEYLSQGMATPERVEERLGLPVLTSVRRFA